MEKSKKPALLTLVRVLEQCQVPYAIIGGIAVQVHHPDPRTTLDIDLAVPSRDDIPRDALTSAGFHFGGSSENSENWTFEDGTPVQFTDDPQLVGAVKSAGEVVVDQVPIRVIKAADLLHAKIRAASDPARRRSRRLQDLADAEALMEAHPDLAELVDGEERAILDRLPK